MDLEALQKIPHAASHRLADVFREMTDSRLT
jgi:hypothetical protein